MLVNLKNVLASIIFSLILVSYINAEPERKILHPQAFLPGERLEFVVSFEFIHAGHASMEVLAEEENINGRDCYHIVSKARSNSTVDMFYKVRDKVETWRDIGTGYSRRYAKKLREGRHKYDRQVDYFPEDSIAIVDKKRKKNQLETLKVGPVQDILSCFYETRTRKLEVGKYIELDIEDDDKFYQLQVHVLGKEKVKVPAGEFECFIVEPRLKTSGLFRSEGTLQVWITDDENRMPVLMKSKLYFGRVFAKLVKYQLGSHEKK